MSCDMKLTEKQKRFADEYIRTGNITQSYLIAYPNVTKETTAAANGSRLLKNAKVKNYIDERLEELKKESIAEQDEILQFLTKVMRGEVTEEVPLGIGEGYQELKDKEPYLKDRLKAAELLGKRYMMFTDRQQVDITGAVQFIDDISDSDAD